MDEEAVQSHAPAGSLTLAICIPSKNRPDDIARCLESIRRQTVRPQQIIIIDQSKTRYELPPLEGLVHVYNPEITGSAAARNVAWSLSSSDIVFFLDDDVELLDGCIAQLLRGFDLHPDAICLQCAITRSSEEFSLSRLMTHVFQRGFFNSAEIHRRGFTELRRAAGGATGFRQSLFEAEKFDERLIGYSYGEDWEFSYRAARYGRLLLLPDAPLVHHTSPVNRHRMEQLLRDRWDNFLYFYEKLQAGRRRVNAIWRVWWMFGESLKWARLGLGFPLLGIRTKKTPLRSLSLRPER
ncbi:MAG: hypothetical protein DLM53_03285 [Candidatus Eremiobacter antarcticus]|nr:glycosyltransferase [Candidatus Eremiobacteraeota bacterium]PZR63796.1 MAG: hypothetical protein DLM53_03285 [Candidatus Eremiobacter sp. RRmetagenome_bin22]